MPIRDGHRGRGSLPAAEVETPGTNIIRRMGRLKATQVGDNVLYQLPDVLAFLETQKEENPR